MTKQKIKRMVAALTAVAGSTPPLHAGTRDFEAVLLKLSRPESRPAVVDVLARQGLAPEKIQALVTALDRFDCEAALDPTRRVNAAALQQLADVRRQFFSYVQQDRLEAIYADVRLMDAGPIPASAVAAPVELRIAPDSFWRTRVKNLDRNTIYETFRQAMAYDAGQPNSKLKSGTIVHLKSARAKADRLSLSVNVTGADGRTLAVDLNNMPLTASDTAEEMTVIALMTLVASPVLIERPQNLRLEANALRSVAQKLLISASLNPKFGAQDRIALQRVIDTLPTIGTTPGEQLAAIIAAKKQLTDYLSATAQTVAGRTRALETVPRTYVFRPPSNQQTDRLNVVRPRGTSGSTTSTSSYYDPMLCYYNPWLAYPGSPYGCWGPWYLMNIAQGQHDHANAMTQTDYERHANPDRYAVPDDSPSVFRNPQGDVVVVDSWDLSRSRDVDNQGFDAVDRGTWRSEITPPSDVTQSSAPVTDAGRTTASVRVEDGAIITGGGGWFGQGNDKPADNASAGQSEQTTTGDITTTGESTTTGDTTGADF